MAVRRLRAHEVTILRRALASYYRDNRSDLERPAPYSEFNPKTGDPTSPRPAEVTDGDYERIADYIQNLDTWDESDFAENSH